ncbi:MAG: DUF1152 domain-containing protein [Candidatus Thorarchaeota archaeon]
MFKIPFFEEIKYSKSILIAGCGGGYDIYSGIPLYILLKSYKKMVFLANYTFTRIIQIKGQKVGSHCTVIDKDTVLPKIMGHDVFYCPEYDLSKFFYDKKGWDVPIYTLHPVGPKLLKEAYLELVEKLGIDTIILVDGGTDSLLRGDEFGLGTPKEDITSIVSVNSVPIKKKYLACVGFGTDDRHGVAHYDVLKRIAELIKKGGFKGCYSLMKEMPEVQSYIDAVYYSNKRTGRLGSYVQNYVVSAISGEFGDIGSGKSNTRMKQFINPFNSQLWIFDLDKVYDALLYASNIENLSDLGEVWGQIQRFREKTKTDEKNIIPL